MIITNRVIITFQKMESNMKNLLIKTAIIICIFSFQISAQTYGKLYSKNEADNIYGPVNQSIQVSTTEIMSILTKAPDIVMFSIINSSVVILGSDREFLYSTDKINYDENTIFTVYSKSVIHDLLNEGQSDITYIEQREKVLTITNGETTMEFGVQCPPYCE